MFDNELEKKGRRQFVKVAAGSVAVAAAFGGGGYAMIRAKNAKEAKLAELPWPKTSLTPDNVMARALEVEPSGGCAQAVFDAVVGSAAASLGSPYDQFPTAMFRFASGGTQGLGSTCGALTAAAAAFELLSAAPAPLTESLFEWYRKEYLPDRQLANAKFPLIPSVAGSVLCSESTAQWSTAAGQPVDCDARKERCVLLAACVARRAAELLQNQAQARPIADATSDAPHRGCGALKVQTL
jgi:hypothetical protein